MVQQRVHISARDVLMGRHVLPCIELPRGIAALAEAVPTTGKNARKQRAFLIQRTVSSLPISRQILIPLGVPRNEVRPTRIERRARLVNAIARGRRWLDEIVSGSAINIEQIATRQKCSERQVNMTISLAFLAPDLVKAAIDGRLPHGMGVARLCDLPVEWSRQRQMLGLIAP
jgi:hypothetical protein